MCRVLCFCGGLLIVLFSLPARAEISPIPLELRLGPAFIVYDAAAEGQELPLADLELAAAAILFERLHVGLGGTLDLSPGSPDSIRGFGFARIHIPIFIVEPFVGVGAGYHWKQVREGVEALGGPQVGEKVGTVTIFTDDGFFGQAEAGVHVRVFPSFSVGATGALLYARSSAHDADPIFAAWVASARASLELAIRF
ncbi:MAG: hypothetical protein FJ109_06610 [Deltaproteobacteria bacterium]|nr:hypothetical protein [Deltaproteobacteria bacterium]